MTKITTINLAMIFGIGITNCYLIENNGNCVLVDTGGSNRRKELLRELNSSGCKPGQLKLVVLTHGDFDHSGNAAWLRNVFGCRIAMHRDDAGMVERGDMFVNRKKPNVLIRKMIPLFTGFGRAEQFIPDLFIGDGNDLVEYGVDARVLAIPGHSKGSIGILMSGGDLFCGDLFENVKNPSMNSIMDDPDAAETSVEKLKKYEIKTVYPGHGRKFQMRLLREANQGG